MTIWRVDGDGSPAMIGSSQAARLAELVVFASNGLKGAMEVLVPPFEKASGHWLTVTYDASDLLVRSIDEGKPFDLVIVTPALLAELGKRGKVVEATAKTVARVGLGLAVKRGAARPNIGSPEAFKAALLDARAVAYTTAGQSGQQFMGIVDRLGIADAVKAKAKTMPSGNVAELLARGEAELAIQLIPELRAVSDAELVAPLPAPLQTYVVFAGAVASATKEKSAAQALLEFLVSPEAQSVIRAKGMEAGS